jgi:hypothetical protein
MDLSLVAVTIDHAYLAGSVFGSSEFAQLVSPIRGARELLPTEPASSTYPPSGAPRFVGQALISRFSENRAMVQRRQCNQSAETSAKTREFAALLLATWVPANLNHYII